MVCDIHAYFQLDFKYYYFYRAPAVESGIVAFFWRCSRRPVKKVWIDLFAFGLTFLLITHCLFYIYGENVWMSFVINFPRILSHSIFFSCLADFFASFV